MFKLRTIAVVSCVILLLTVSCVASGCKTDVDVPEKKYDVSLMIMRERYGDHQIDGKWIIPADEMFFEIEQEYDGYRYSYYVFAYNLPDHPNFSDVWFRYNKGKLYGIGYTRFERKSNTGGGGVIVAEYIGDSKGVHTRIINVDEDSRLWKHRRITLQVTIV